MQKTGQAAKKEPKNRIANFRVTQKEYLQIETNAEREGLTFGSYLRTHTVTAPTTRAMRRPVVEKTLLSKLTAELGRSGSNLNQIARAMNSGDKVTSDQIQAALKEHRQILAAIIDVLGRKSR
ncbi:MAG: plasmid mobilization relaxosome protein MobC [Nitrospira sp.]|nr:plasmid mobilization relaxosome protein MobC [Nitrospira sp.]